MLNSAEIKILAYKICMHNKKVNHFIDTPGILRDYSFQKGLDTQREKMAHEINIKLNNANVDKLLSNSETQKRCTNNIKEMIEDIEKIK